MHPTVAATSDLVRAISRIARHYRTPPCALVWLDYRPFRKRPLLHFAAVDGLVHVSRVKDDANPRRHGPATASHDESHAPWHGCFVYGYSLSERPGGVYSHQQLGRDWPAVVFEPQASTVGAGQTRSRQERQEVVASGCISGLSA